MKKESKRPWIRVWNFINNGYVRHVVIGLGKVFLCSTVMMAMLIPRLNDIKNKISQADLQNLVAILLFLVLPALLALWLCKIAVARWRAWCLVRLHGDPISHSFDPLLRLNWWWHRQFKLINFQNVVSQFSADNIPFFLLIPAQLGYLRYGREKPLFVLKLPARTHLAVGDFVVLRMLRHILASGGRLLVIIIDATRDTEEARHDMMEKVVSTRHFLKRMLGAAPKVVTLSEIHMKHAQSATNFLLTHFILFFVKSIRGVMDKGGTNTDIVSFFSKGLILHALSQMEKSDPVIMIQWVKRQDSWVNIYSVLPMVGKKLRITDFLQITNYPTESGTLLGTKNPKFAIVPEGEWISSILDLKSYKNEPYVIALGQALLGKEWNNSESMQEDIQKRFRKELTKVQKSLVL